MDPVRYELGEKPDGATHVVTGGFDAVLLEPRPDQPRRVRTRLWATPQEMRSRPVSSVETAHKDAASSLSGGPSVTRQSAQ